MTSQKLTKGLNELVNMLITSLVSIWPPQRLETLGFQVTLSDKLGGLSH